MNITLNYAARLFDTQIDYAKIINSKQLSSHKIIKKGWRCANDDGVCNRHKTNVFVEKIKVEFISIRLIRHLKQKLISRHRIIRVIKKISRVHCERTDGRST